MNGSLAIGPLALPVAFVVFVVAVAAGWWAAERLGRASGLRLEPALHGVLACGLVGARLAFVLAYRANYAQAPLAILDIRDGGWMPAAGFAAAGLAALVLALRRAPWRKPLAAGWGVATGLWIAGFAAGALLQPASTPLPDVTLSSLDGTPVRLAQLQGKPVVVNLWASWCPPCRREMPVLQQAQRQYADVHFVFLNQGEPPEAVRSFLATTGLTLRNVLLDRRGLAGSQLGGRALPSTFLFDERGRLVGRRVGELSPATLAQLLEPLHLPQPSGDRIDP